MKFTEKKLDPDRYRVLVVSDEKMGDVAGHPLGWHLAESLARDFDVILGTPVYSQASHRSFAVVYYNRRNLGLLSRASDLVVLAPETADRYAFFSESGSLRRFNRSGPADGRLAAITEAVARSHPAPEILLWTPPLPPGGPVYYLRRLHYHLVKGGPRQVWIRLRARLRARKRRA
jgi:hypothetical protein